MAKELRNIILTGSKIVAEFNYPSGNGTKPAKKETGWSQTVKDAAVALKLAAAAEADRIGGVIAVRIEVYTPLSDDAGAPGFTEPGDIIDIKFRDIDSPSETRIGDDEVVPEDLAAARDALRVAVLADLNPVVEGE